MIILYLIRSFIHHFRNAKMRTAVLLVSSALLASYIAASDKSSWPDESDWIEDSEINEAEATFPNRAGPSVRAFADSVMELIDEHAKRKADTEDLAAEYEFAAMDVGADGKTMHPRKMHMPGRVFSAHYQVLGSQRDVFKLCTSVEVPRPIAMRKVRKAFELTANLVQEAATEHLRRQGLETHLMEVVPGDCGHHYSHHWLEKASSRHGEAGTTRVLIQSWAMSDSLSGPSSVRNPNPSDSLQSNHSFNICIIRQHQS